MLTREALQEILDFLNSIEGAGYGGMASFEIARAHVHAAFQAAWAPEPPPDFSAVEATAVSR